MQSEFFSAAFMSALFAIVLIDLVLAGDNALIIGLVARNLPRQTQRKVIFWGTFGAIAVRGLMAILVVYVLDLPGFMLAGAIALVWIARKLLTPDPEAAGNHAAAVPAATFAVALRTIVVADAVMGVDNVLAVGGAAHGSLLLVLIGLAVSVPIVIWGSTLVLKWVERYPAILWLGAAVIGWTAAKMIASEPLLAVALHEMRWLHTALYVAIVGGLAGAPAWRMLDASHRLHVATLAVVAAWLVAFGWLDERLAAAIDPAAVWQWDESLVDFVRWIGWIPIVIAMQRAMRAAAKNTRAKAP